MFVSLNGNFVWTIQPVAGTDLNFMVAFFDLSQIIDSCSEFIWYYCCLCGSKILLKCRWINSYDADDMVEDNRVLVPKIPVGVSGTALAASLLRDGWSVSLLVFLISVFFFVCHQFWFDFVFLWIAGQNVCKIPRGCWCFSTWAIGKEGIWINIATGILYLTFVWNFFVDTRVFCMVMLCLTMCYYVIFEHGYECYYFDVDNWCWSIRHGNLKKPKAWNTVVTCG